MLPEDTSGPPRLFRRLQPVTAVFVGLLAAAFVLSLALPGTLQLLTADPIQLWQIWRFWLFALVEPSLLHLLLSSCLLLATGAILEARLSAYTMVGLVLVAAALPALLQGLLLGLVRGGPSPVVNAYGAAFVGLSLLHRGSLPVGQAALAIALVLLALTALVPGTRASSILGASDVFAWFVGAGAVWLGRKRAT